MKTGYPFLQIAKKHNLDYAAVLMAADYGRFNGTPPGTARSQAHYEAFKSIPDAAMEDIIAASDHFTQTQYGLIPDPFTEKFDLT